MLKVIHVYRRWHSRWKMVLRYALIDSKLIAEEIGKKETGNKRIAIFGDMIKCYHKYHIWTNQYKKERFWELTSIERDELGAKYYLRNKHADDIAIEAAVENELFVKEYDANRRFLAKWSSFKYEKSSKARIKRTQAYIKRYKIGRSSFVGYGVLLVSEHGTIGELKWGDKVKLVRELYIDYTGGLTVGNGVSFAEGALVFTHGHSYMFRKKECLNKYNPNTFATPLTIGDNVFIGSRAIIMPGVGSIGENSVISAGAIVTRPVPPNSIVTGNPARVVPIPPGTRTYYSYEKDMYDYDSTFKF